MKQMGILSLAALVAGCTADPRVESAAVAETQTALAEELRGRVAGEPQTCVQLRGLGGNRSVGDAIVFEGPGSVVYVSRPVGGCPDLRYNRALQTRTTGTQLCRGDIATVFDPATGTRYGSCGLGDFVPYRRAEG